MTHEDLLKEASNPSTDPQRLRELVDHEDEAIYGAAWRNPSLPEDILRQALLGGFLEAWSNPMASLYVLTWTPREDDWRTLEDAAQAAMHVLREKPEHCSAEGKVLIAAKFRDWWATSEDVEIMMAYLGWWAKEKGKDSLEHRQAVRVLVHCVRTAPHLTVKDCQALDLLDAWNQGDENKCKEAYALANAEVVNDACRFAQNNSYNINDVIFDIIKAVAMTAGMQASSKHSSLLADVIRREMPLPPVVE